MTTHKPIQPAYDIIIPGPVRQDTRLTDGQRILYGELRGLCRKDGFCWASNTYLARIRGKHVRSIQSDIHRLDARGHIRIEYDPDNKNLRKIFMTDGAATGMKNNAGGMKNITYTMQNNAGGMKNNCSRGMKNIAPQAGCIRNNNINNTSSSADAGQEKHKPPAAAGDDDEKKIPEKIKRRFDSARTLKVFAAACVGDVGRMARYLEYADRRNAKNPTGLAVALAREHGAAGPPDGADRGACAFCDASAEKVIRYSRERVGMCTAHLMRYKEEKRNGSHLDMLDKAIAMKGKTR